MNIATHVILSIGEVEILLRSLHQHPGRYRVSKILRTWLVALRKALNTFIKLISLYRVGAVPWTPYYLRLVVLSIEVNFFCRILVLLILAGEILIAESLELKTIVVLWLQNDLA